MKTLTPAQRLRRDEKALERILAGESPAEVAAKARISVMQLYRRLGPLKAIRRAEATRRTANA